MKEYKCNECINQRSPLCDVCYQRESPNDDPSKPTYYQEYTGEIVDVSKFNNIVSYIIARTSAGVPIPINAIILYNDIISGGGLYGT